MVTTAPRVSATPGGSCPDSGLKHFAIPITKHPLRRVLFFAGRMPRSVAGIPRHGTAAPTRPATNRPGISTDEWQATNRGGVRQSPFVSPNSAVHGPDSRSELEAEALQQPYYQQRKPPHPNARCHSACGDEPSPPRFHSSAADHTRPRPRGRGSGPHPNPTPAFRAKTTRRRCFAEGAGISRGRRENSSAPADHGGNPRYFRAVFTPKTAGIHWHSGCYSPIQPR